MAYFKPARSHWRRKKIYHVKDKVAAAGGFSLTMKLHPDFGLCVNLLKSRTCLMKCSPYILPSV